MRYSQRILNSLLERLIPCLKDIVNTLQSKIPDDKKLFEIQLLLWNVENDLKQEMKVFIEHQIFSAPSKIKKEQSQVTGLIHFKNHKVDPIYYFN